MSISQLVLMKSLLSIFYLACVTNNLTFAVTVSLPLCNTAINYDLFSILIWVLYQSVLIMRLSTIKEQIAQNRHYLLYLNMHQ